MIKKKRNLNYTSPDIIIILNEWESVENDERLRFDSTYSSTVVYVTMYGKL